MHQNVQEDVRTNILVYKVWVCGSIVQYSGHECTAKCDMTKFTHYMFTQQAVQDRQSLFRKVVHSQAKLRNANSFFVPLSIRPFICPFMSCLTSIAVLF